MRHGHKFNKLGRDAEHRRALLKNLSAELFDHGYIVTTLAKAKALRPFAEKIITQAKKAYIAGTAEQRIALLREIAKKVPEKQPFNNLTRVWAAVCLDRPGGYLRIIKLQNRKGDNADLAYIGVVTDQWLETKDKKIMLGTKAMFSELQEDLIHFHLSPKKLLEQWSHFRMPHITVEKQTTRDKKTFTLMVKFTPVKEETAGWPAIRGGYAALPLAFCFESNERENLVLDFKSDNNQLVKKVSRYNRADRIDFLVNYTEDPLMVAVKLGFRKGKGEKVQDRLDRYCTLKIKGPVGDLLVCNIINQSSHKDE